MGTQLPSAPQAVCLCLSCSHAPMTPPPKKHNFPTGLRVRVQLPSVAFPIYSQITITITQGDEASISKTQHTAISQASWSILLVCIPKDLRMPCSFARTPWPEASVPLAGHDCEKTQPAWGEGSYPQGHLPWRGLSVMGRAGLASYWKVAWPVCL